VTAKAPVWGWMMGSTANGIWENYHMASEHMNIATSFLRKKFLKMAYLLQIFLQFD
jgi:hypothetical protein